MNYNFYCSVCLDNLIKYYKNIFNETDIDGIINCLDSFNLEDVLKDEEDMEQFKVAVGEAINFASISIPV